MVDCDNASSRECHHAKHAANAFDTEKVALMHGIFQLLQPAAGEPVAHCMPSKKGCIHCNEHEAQAEVMDSTVCSQISVCLCKIVLCVCYESKDRRVLLHIAIDIVT